MNETAAFSMSVIVLKSSVWNERKHTQKLRVIVRAIIFLGPDADNTATRTQFFRCSFPVETILVLVQFFDLVHCFTGFFKLDVFA